MASGFSSQVLWYLSFEQWIFLFELIEGENPFTRLYLHSRGHLTIETMTIIHHRLPGIKDEANIHNEYPKQDQNPDYWGVPTLLPLSND